ncbi:hypothetical protein Krac_9694 [Ktedonobacter racemifer DSM 44963]|uniref:Uncharacterized protein n=2 Tax=Ktedonobacter racemifer TaxID=363277 RepID=D6TDC7_KTERA|nr:hypothetical protein Krac_9694 [Ktedonobacter racemifer DSM 44963]
MVIDDQKDLDLAETMTEIKQCARPGCTNPVEIIPGHRPRKYCGNGCKQLAYLQREDEKRLQAEAAAQQAQYERDVDALRQRYGLDSLSPKVLDGLLQLRSHYSVGLMYQVGEMLILAVKEAHRSYNEAVNALREEIMLVGEQLNFVAITGPQNQTLRGVQPYCDAIGRASLEELYAMRDSVHLARRARQHLAEVSAQLEAKYSNRHADLS